MDFHSFPLLNQISVEKIPSALGYAKTQWHLFWQHKSSPLYPCDFIPKPSPRRWWQGEAPSQGSQEESGRTIGWNQQNSSWRDSHLCHTYFHPPISLSAQILLWDEMQEHHWPQEVTVITSRWVSGALSRHRLTGLIMGECFRCCWTMFYSNSWNPISGSSTVCLMTFKNISPCNFFKWLATPLFE